MTTERKVDPAMIEMMQKSLDEARLEFAEVEKRYNDLKATIFTYETSLRNFSALAEGRTQVKDNGIVDVPQRSNQELKDVIYEYFSNKPRFSQSPKGLTRWLISQGWAEKGLNMRVSNLLRKVVDDDNEKWLIRAGHGKYQFGSNA